jgi:hypothetical protein
MKHADQVLADELLVAAVYEALAKRRPKSRSRGRQGTPAEAVGANPRGPHGDRRSRRSPTTRRSARYYDRGPGTGAACRTFNRPSAYSPC